MLSNRLRMAAPSMFSWQVIHSYYRKAKFTQTKWRSLILSSQKELLILTYFSYEEAELRKLGQKLLPEHSILFPNSIKKKLGEKHVRKVEGYTCLILFPRWFFCFSFVGFPSSFYPQHSVSTPRINPNSAS